MAHSFFDSDACERFFCFRNSIRYINSSNPKHVQIRNAKNTIEGLYDATLREFNNWRELNPFGYEKRQVLDCLSALRNDFNLSSEDLTNGVEFYKRYMGNTLYQVRVRLFSYTLIDDDNYNELVEVFRDGRIIMTCVTPGSYSDGLVFWFLHEQNFGLTLYWGKSKLRFKTSSDNENEQSGFFSFFKKLF